MHFCLSWRIILLVLMVMVFINTPAVYSEESASKIITAQEIHLVDSAGTLRMKLDGNEAGITIYDTNERPRVELYVHDESEYANGGSVTTRLNLYDDTPFVRAAVSVDSDNIARVDLFGAEMKKTAILSGFPDGRTDLRFFDPTGQKRVIMGYYPGGNIPMAQLFDSSGNTTVIFGEGLKGRSGLFALRQDGKTVWSVPKNLEGETLQ